MAIISIPTSIGGINIPGGVFDGPLGSLYKNDGLDFVQYPRDLGNSTRNHVVHFTINEVKEVTVSDVPQSVQNFADTVSSAINNRSQTVSAAQNRLTGAAATVVDAVTDLSSLTPAEATNRVLGAVTSGGESAYKTLQTISTPTTKPVAHIALYMPENLTFTQSADYNNGITLASAAGALPLVGGIASKLTSVMDNTALKLALNKAGYVFNAQQQVLFEGITFREFELSFTFTPYSRDEAESVRKIIKLFRSYSSPTIITQAAGMFFKPPAVFEVDLRFNGSHNINVPKFKKSVIKNVDVNYAPNGWAAHTDGAPVQTIMTLQFQEIAIVDKAAVDQGF